MSKTALVTGGAGFIGSNLCEFLLAKDYTVICVDNVVSGAEENVEPFQKDSNFKFINHDIVKPLKVEEKLDEVWNLAAIASPIWYQEKPIETLLSGSDGVKNMLDLALEHEARFLQTSTSEVYGDPLEHPQKETYWGHVNPIGPRSCYDESKRFAEALIMAYHRTHKLDSKIVRIFNTYGPRMARDGRVVPAFINQALRGEPLTVFGDGKQTRSFCFISDQLAGLWGLMNSDYHEPVNIGNPKEFDMLELAELVIKLTGSKSELVFKPLPADDPVKRRPDISLADKLFGFAPKVSLAEGLKPTIEYFKSKL